jgi:hypothetical protein
MLYNKQGQQVVVPAKYNSIDNPGVFRPLYEKLESSNPNGRGLPGAPFSLEARATYKS